MSQTKAILAEVLAVLTKAAANLPAVDVSACELIDDLLTTIEEWETT